MFRRFVDWLALTNNERKAILFLIGVMIVGTGVRIYRATFPSAPAFDYRASDSTFAALSRAPATGTDADSSVGDEDRVALNAATKETLMTLDGIGAVTAERILRYRKDHGRFTSVDDLLQIKGMSKKKLNRIRPHLTLD